MLDNGLAVLLGIFVKNGLQLRMNGTLTAVREDDCVERLVEFIENNLVVADKGIRPDAVRPEVDSTSCQSKPDPLMVTEVAR